MLFSEVHRLVRIFACQSVKHRVPNRQEDRPPFFQEPYRLYEIVLEVETDMSQLCA